MAFGPQLNLNRTSFKQRGSSILIFRANICKRDILLFIFILIKLFLFRKKVLFINVIEIKGIVFEFFPKRKNKKKLFLQWKCHLLKLNYDLSLKYNLVLQLLNSWKVLGTGEWWGDTETCLYTSCRENYDPTVNSIMYQL